MKAAPPSEGPNLLTALEAAKVLGVSVPTVHRMAARGTLETAHKSAGRTGQRLFTEEAVNKALEELEAPGPGSVA